MADKAEELARLAENILDVANDSLLGYAQKKQAVAALLRPHLGERWIPVGERLPKLAELPCLYIDHVGKHKIGPPTQYDRCWRPLPAPPAEEER